MLFNGAFSLVSGAFFAIAPGIVDGWLGFTASGWIRLVGLVLFGHGLILFWAARRHDRAKWARLNLLAIAPYPILLIGLVAGGVIDRTLGQGLALFDAAVVAAIAVWHFVSLREPRRASQPQPA